MSEMNNTSAAVLDGDSALREPRGSEDTAARAERNGKSIEAATQPREAAIPDPEVSARPKRRRFSADYKARVVEEAEACTAPGETGALLRREGLYSSQLSEWRKQYRRGALRALRDDKRGRETKKHPLEDENAKLRKHNERLARRLEQAEMIIEIQKKVATMLGIPLNSVENEEAE